VNFDIFKNDHQLLINLYRILMTTFINNVTINLKFNFLLKINPQSNNQSSFLHKYNIASKWELNNQIKNK
jgi:hypothetical protein